MSLQSSFHIGVSQDEIRLERELSRFKLYEDKEVADCWRRMFRQNGLRQITARYFGAGTWMERGQK